jgi:F420H(2)-dependent quinone reductase
MRPRTLAAGTLRRSDELRHTCWNPRWVAARHRRPDGPVVHEAGREPDPPHGQADGLERPGPDDHRPQERSRTHDSGDGLVSRRGRQLADRGRSERRARNPAWCYNIAAHPDKVQIETPGRTVAVIAEQLHGSERDEAWRQITAASPGLRRISRRPTANCRSSRGRIQTVRIVRNSDKLGHLCRAGRGHADGAACAPGCCWRSASSR